MLSEFASGKKEKSNCVKGNRFRIGMPSPMTKTTKRATKKRLRILSFSSCWRSQSRPCECVRAYGVPSNEVSIWQVKKEKENTRTQYHEEHQTIDAFSMPQHSNWNDFNETRRTFVISGRAKNQTRTYRTPFACV